MKKKQYDLKTGNSYPFGCTVNGGGVNFSIFSRYATEVELLLFESSEDKEPFQVVT